MESKISPAKKSPAHLPPGDTDRVTSRVHTTEDGDDGVGRWSCRDRAVVNNLAFVNHLQNQQRLSYTTKADLAAVLTHSSRSTMKPVKGFFKKLRQGGKNKGGDPSLQQHGTKDLTGAGPPSLNEETIYTGTGASGYAQHQRPPHSRHAQQQQQPMSSSSRPQQPPQAPQVDSITYGTNPKGHRVTSTTVRVPPTESAESAPMVDSANVLTRNLVKKFIAEIWNRGEIDQIPDVCSPNLRLNGNTGFDRVGHDGLARMVSIIREAVSDYHCEIHSMVVEHNKAFCRLRFTGKHTGSLMGYEATGKGVAWMGATEFTCQNGKILKVWELGDVKSLEEQLKSAMLSEEEI